jgi:hypothetical protein
MHNTTAQQVTHSAGSVFSIGNTITLLVVVVLITLIALAALVVRPRRSARSDRIKMAAAQDVADIEAASESAGPDAAGSTADDL